VEPLTQAIRILKTPVTLIVLLVILIGGGYWGMKAATAPIVSSDSQCVMTDVGTSLTPAYVSVRLLNAGAPSGAAKRAAAWIRAYGFNVVRINNSDREVVKTVIIGNSVDSPEVKLMMQVYPEATAEGDDRTDHVVDVLIGPSTTTTPVRPTSVSVSGSICLPPESATASASSSSSAATEKATSSTSAKKK
jgi:hypothetical protein